MQRLLLALLTVALGVLCIRAETLPIVVWHALGSNCCEGFTTEFISMLEKELPTAHIVSIRVGGNPSEDSYKSYFDNANRQINEVCTKLQRDPTLRAGFNAIGLSQGGLLARALIERCTGLKVHRLITFGSPHQGVSAFPGCGDIDGWAKWSPSRWLGYIFKKVRQNLIPCSVMNTLVGTSVYSGNAQSNVMPAQYYKDPQKLASYYRSNKFLVDINNEASDKNPRYRENMLRLDKFVMYSFEKEEVVHPPESTKFGYYASDGKRVLSIKDTQGYKEDWIGLRTLDQRRALVQIKLPGEHLNINQNVIRQMANSYLKN